MRIKRERTRVQTRREPEFPPAAWQEFIEIKPKL